MTRREKYGEKCLMIIKNIILKCTGWYSVHIQPNTAKLISQHFTVQIYHDPRDNAKATGEPWQRNGIFFNCLFI